MNARSPEALPAHLRRRAEIIGFACGLCCFPFTFFGTSWGTILPAGPAGVVLPIVFFSALAGCVATVLRFGLDADAAAVFAPRVGVRAGVVAALSGGAVTVLAATLQSFGLSAPNNPHGWMAVSMVMLPTSRPWQFLFISLLGVPPAIFFGMAASLLTAMARSPRTPITSGDPAVQPQASRGLLLSVILVIAVLGYLSPFLLTLRQKPKPTAARSLPTTPAPSTPAPPPAPKWRYEKPDGFDAAPATQITITQQRVLGEVDTNSPVALSPDERLFASFRRGSMLEIRELETLDVVGRIDVSQSPDGLSWSPDGTQLLISTANPRGLFVFKMASRALLALPQPVGGRIPQGKIEWWDSNEVLFQTGGGPKFLDLENLHFREAAASPKWNKLSKEQQDVVRAGTSSFHLPNNPRWHLRIQPSLLNYGIPLDPKADWNVNAALHLVAFDPTRSYRATLPYKDIEINDSIVGTSDGSKVICLHRGQATVLYMGLRPEPATWIKVAMSAPPAPSVLGQLSKKTLCAFICTPLVNPLNGRTVGPDRSHIKALARFHQWQDKEAELWIEEQDWPISLGDVVADIHTWEDHRVRPVADAPPEWFSVIDRRYTQPAPNRSEAPELERVVTIAINPSRGADHIDHLEPRQYQKQLPTPEPTGPKRGLFERAFGKDTVFAKIDDFIRKHHEKSSRGDVGGLIADYAPQVDHFNNGVVDRDFIRKDELEYHSPGTRVTEVITTVPVIAALNATMFSATYTISFHRVRPDGKWFKGNTDVDLQIDVSGGAPQIVRQRGQTRDLQKGP